MLLIFIHHINLPLICSHRHGTATNSKAGSHCRQGEQCQCYKHQPHWCFNLFSSSRSSEPKLGSNTAWLTYADCANVDRGDGVICYISSLNANCATERHQVILSGATTVITSMKRKQKRKELQFTDQRADPSVDLRIEPSLNRADLKQADKAESEQCARRVFVFYSFSSNISCC